MKRRESLFTASGYLWSHPENSAWDLHDCYAGSHHDLSHQVVARVAVTEATVLSCGALENDRRFALVDETGAFVNAKRFAVIHRVQATYTDPMERVCLSAGPRQAHFSLLHDREAIGVWLSQVLGIPCHLVEGRAGGFPDDTDGAWSHAGRDGIPGNGGRLV